MFTRRPAFRNGQSGISLIELVMFIIIVSVAMAGIMSIFISTTKSSADPMQRKQAIAIAESLLEEVELQPFTFCDPDDPQASTAISSGVGATACTSAATVQANGPTAGESRGSTTSPFDNVIDYSGFSMAGITSLDDTATVISGLSAYTATVTITPEAVGAVPSTASLRIDVRVTRGTDVDITLTGYRMQYAPRTTP